MATIFTRIINGDIPGVFVHRDERCVAFMSINPLAPGHTLVVPIDEVDEWTSCSPELATHLFGVAHRIGRAQKTAFACDRVGVIVAGYEVPHAHIHVVPTSSMRELDFANAAEHIDSESLQANATRLRDALVHLP